MHFQNSCTPVKQFLHKLLKFKSITFIKNFRKEKDVLKLEDLQKLIVKDHINVKWKGQKFEPKDLKLYRFNAKNLK